MLTEVQTSCGVAEGSHMPLSLALLAEELIPCFKHILLFSSSGGPKAQCQESTGKRGCSWCAQLDKIPDLREWVELLERRSVNFDVKGRCKGKGLCYEC